MTAAADTLHALSPGFADSEVTTQHEIEAWSDARLLGAAVE